MAVQVLGVLVNLNCSKKVILGICICLFLGTTSSLADETSAASVQKKEKLEKPLLTTLEFQETAFLTERDLATQYVLQQNKIAELELQNDNYKFYILFAAVIFLAALTLIQFRYQQILKKSARDAKEANQAKSDFLASMSHEFRTPLNAIIGFSESLKTTKFGNLNDQQKKFVEYIHDGGNILLKLINDILDLAKIEASSFKLNMGNHLVKNILREITPMMDNMLEKKGVSLHIENNIGGETKVRVDEIRMKQVLMNLISNAIKYGNQGGNIWVETAEVVPGYLRLSVRDDGIGIDYSQFHNIFKPFHRAGMENSDIEGTGAGLAIVQTLVHAMEGTIDFESVYGEGSIFWVDFPIVKE